MKSEHHSDAAQPETPREEAIVTRLLVLPDGRVLVHNLTTAIAQILQRLDPADPALLERGRLGEGHVQPASSNPETPVPVIP
jgi:hypothetical protein